METWASDILKTAQGTNAEQIKTARRQVKVTVRAETSEGERGGEEEEEDGVLKRFCDSSLAVSARRQHKLILRRAG